MQDHLITGAVDESMKEQVSVTREQSHENDFERPAKSRSSSTKRGEIGREGEAQKMRQRLAPDFLSVSKMARQVICEAQKKGLVAVIAFLASCDTLYPLIQEAIQAQMVTFVLDDRLCIKVPIKSPFLFVDKTFLSDVTQAVTDVVSFNEMNNVVIIYEDDQDDNSVVTWNERIKIEKLIQKLSTNLIHTTLFKISPHFKKLLSPSPSSTNARTSFQYIHRYNQNSGDNNKNRDNENQEDLHSQRQQQDGEASLNMLIDLMAHKIEAFDTGIGGWRSTGITLVALTERPVLDSLINLLVREGKFPLSTTIFHVDTSISFPLNNEEGGEIDSDHQLKQEPSKYWFDQQQIILKRRYHSKLVKFFQDLTINHAPENQHLIGPRESFIICAIESISDSAHYIINERVEQVKSLSACDLNQDRQVPSASGGLNPTQIQDTSKNNNENGPPEMFAEAILV